MKKFNYAKQINKPMNHTTAINYIESLVKAPHIHIVKTQCKLPLPSRAIILDFEGNPVFLVGMMIDTTLLSLYIKEFEYRTDLYLVLMQMFSTIHQVVYFTFSDHEKEEIKKFYHYLTCQDLDLSKYVLCDEIPIINLQLNKFESVLEALYSVHPKMKITGDALFRNTRLVDQLFYAKKYDEIVLHNQNCLKNESIILNKRWMKLYIV